MRGKIKEERQSSWFIDWTWEGARYKIRKFQGVPFKRMHADRDRCQGFQRAMECLTRMRKEVDADIFKIEQYAPIEGEKEKAPAVEQAGWTDAIGFLREWLDLKKPKEGQVLGKATYKDYRCSVNNWIIPYLQKNPKRLHEIDYNYLCKLKKSIDRAPKGVFNVMNCMHAAMDHAWRDNKIAVIPPFPKKGDYGLSKPLPVVLTEERQLAIINAIRPEDQPLYWFLKYMMRRPAEAFALYREDYNPKTGQVHVHRAISVDKYVERTKTGDQHILYAPDVLMDILAAMPKPKFISPYLFTTPASRVSGHRYTRTIFEDRWYKACDKVGEDINPYNGLKHTSACAFLNEHGGNLRDLQVVTDHANFESVKHYGKYEYARKKQLMEQAAGAAIPFRKRGDGVSGSHAENA